MKMVHNRTYEIVAQNMSDSQIGARKQKSVRNHIFVLNSIFSDVLSSGKKTPVDLNIMDFRQMFDAEEAPITLNSFYEAGIQNDIFALICAANENATFAVKTPSGLTEKTTIRNKIMQGDVLSPLVSSVMVDQNIGKQALKTGNSYMYKGIVEIPPLAMQDDTLGISDCGIKSKAMNEFLNTRTNLMSLQFGNDKCVKMHVGKNHQTNICPDLLVDCWKEVLVDEGGGKKSLKDIYRGREVMKNVLENKYLGDIVSSDGKNNKNIKDRINKAIGNVNKIFSTLNERPYGRHYFEAYKLMREGLLLGGMLTNSESWINVTKQNLDDLEKPDTILQRKVLSVTSNPSKCFMKLELGILPVKFVIMKKRLMFLQYILKENKESMIKKSI